LRLAAIEERVDLDLALGRGSDLVSELETLVAQNPYRERLRVQLMLALYRAGRQADALAAYQDARQLFVDELGIEPSPALQRLEQAILRQESGLEALLDAVEEEPETQDEVPPGDARATSRVRVRRPVVALAAALVLAGVAAAAGVGLGAKTSFRHSVDANAIGILDPEAAQIEDQIGYVGPSSGIASDGKTVWLAGTDSGTVTRIAPNRRTFVSRDFGSTDGVAYGSGSLWVTDSRGRVLLQLRPDSFEVVQHIKVGNGPRAVKVGQNAAWVANTIDGTVTRIDLDRKVAPQTIPVGPGPVGIAIGGGGIWVTSAETTRVVRIDADSTGIVEPIPVGNGAGGVAYGEGAVWVANRDDDTVSRIDPATRKVTNTIPGFDKPEAVLAKAGSIWVTNAGDGTIKRIDPRGRDPRIDATVKLRSRATGMVFVGGKLWASTIARSGHRGGVLRVELTPSECRCVDPADWPLEITQLVYDGLVAYRRVGGTAGETLVPNLAERILAPTDGGKTYTFQLRRGLRYSNGEPVRASDFRRSLERVMRIWGAPDPYYRSIVGAAACDKKKCDLSHGIETDDRNGTIVIRLTSPDPELLHELALPSSSIVPPATPARRARRHPIPSIGPYRVASITPREVVLARNEHFRLWSADARPNGYADEIRFRLRSDSKARLAAVKREASDWLDVAHVGPAELQGLTTRFASRLHTNPASSSSYWFFLNTRVPPFDDVRVRQAINYAVDRKRIIALSGEVAEPSCQILPPILPGYRPHCPYTRNPNPAGTWTAPDVARARALVEASRTEGTPVEVDIIGRYPLGRYVASVLRELGYKSSVRVFEDPNLYYAYVGNPRNRAQIGWAGWIPDFLAASNFVRPLFTCGAPFNLFQYCSHAVDDKMMSAVRLQGSDTRQATEVWAEVDRDLVKDAVALPWGTPRRRVLVSERVGNVQGHPLWGTLFDQLWVQ